MATSSSNISEDGKQQWIDIQQNTFANWINDQMQERVIYDLSTDLADGVWLIRLVETLQGRRYFGKVYDENPTEIQQLMNVQMALDALREDGVKTVNIGSDDIVNGNTKLILGLVWCLIQKYQIASRTKIPPKKLVMAWMQSVLPELKLTNFRTHWNDGRALSGLLEFCQPGLCPEWRNCDPNKAHANCARALLLAEQYLNIPRILLPEYLSSPHLDELSCITYLSYFLTRGGPGYRATLQRAQMLIPDCDVPDFDISWSDGYALAMLIEAVGGSVPEFQQMQFETYKDCVQNIGICLEAAIDIGVGSLVGADDIADPRGEHLGTMALVAALCSAGPALEIPVTQCFTNQQVNLDLAFSEGSEVRVEELDVTVLGPEGMTLSGESIGLRKSRTVTGAVLSMVPTHPGFHQVRIFCQGSELPSSPISLQVLTSDESRALSSRSVSRVSHQNQPPSSSLGRPPSKSIERTDSASSDIDISHKPFAQRRLHIIKQLEAQNAQIREQLPPPPAAPSTKAWQERAEKHSATTSSSAVVVEASAHREMPLSRPSDVGLVSFSGLTEPCSVGSIVEVVINAHGETSTAGSVYVDAVAPSGTALNCQVIRRHNSYMATFTPTEVGLWRIGILYEGEHIKGSPFACQVFDAGLVNVYGLDVGLVGQELRFTVNSSQAGHGNTKVSVFRHGREIPSSVDSQGAVHRVTFVPDGAGQYKIHVLFNRMEVKGSPFILDIADASSVSVFGENLRMASVGREAAFMVHAAGADVKDISVAVTAPSGRMLSAQIHPIDDVSYRAVWTPSEAGEHSIDVRMFDQSVYESPFVCNVGAPELVSVRSMPRRIQTKDLYTDQSFEIDASAAGSGNLEIMINGGRVPCRVKELGSRQYMAIFTPTQSITHTIEMRFNGVEVAGSPWKLPVEEKGESRKVMDRTQSYYSELSGAGLVRAPINKTASFDISGDGLELNDIQAKIFGTDGQEYPIRIVPRGTGKYTAEYTIEKVGEHQLTVWIAGRKVDGSPLSVAGYASQKVRIEPLGGGNIGQPVQFVVDAVEAGKGQLEISVNQGRVPNNVQMQGAGRCLVTFIPQHAGTYVIDVTFNGEQVHGCPIKVEILPKQIGQQVQANLTPTAVSAAINAGGTSSISSAVRRGARSPTSPTSPTSPGLLRHARQRSEDSPRSAQLLNDVRGRSEQPWKSSFAPSSSRVSSSLSPQREWTANAVYDKIYGSGNEVDRTLSPSDPSRHRVFSETTTTTTTVHRTPTPTGVRSREFADRQAKTPSPTPYGRRFDSPFTNRPRDADYRSPSPTREDISSRVTTSPYRQTPSPGPTERVRRIERFDPLAEEEERERRRRQMESEKSTGVGYTVAQYGEPGSVSLERASPAHSSRQLGVKETQPKTPSPLPPYEPVIRPKSPEYSTVYEKYERKSEGRVAEKASPVPPTVPPPRDQPFRSPSPTPDYDSRPTGTTFKKYESQYIESRPTPYTVGLPERPMYEEGKRSTEPVVRAITPEGHVEADSSSSSPAKPLPSILKTAKDEGFAKSMKSSAHTVKRESPVFMRTQSEVLERDLPPSSLQRSDEKESVYDAVPRTESPSASEQERRESELARVKAEDKEILSKHGFLRRPIHDVSVEIDEPLGDIDDVVEMAGSKDNLAGRVGEERGVDTHAHFTKKDEGRVQSLEPASELPHSPAPSAPVTPATTPKLSAKFKKEGKEAKPYDFGKSKFSSKHEVVRRGKEVEVKLDSLKLGKEDVLRVVVTAPIKATTPGDEPPEVETKVKKSGNKYEISFKPSEVGTHKVYAYVNEVLHPLSPFAIRVYDAAEILVGEIPSQSRLNDTVEFTVDAGRAGFGNLEMAIKDSDGVIIPSHVAQLESGSAKFLVTFTPASKGLHTVNITFNKEVLKNSPFEVQITDAVPLATEVVSEEATSPQLTKKNQKKEKEDRKREEKERAKREKEEKAATLKMNKKGKGKHITKTAVTKIPSLSRVGLPSGIIVEVAGGDQLLVSVTDPSKKEIGTEITQVEPGVMQINFTPSQVGDHDIDVRYGGVPVTGSPFTCRAYDPAMIRVGTIPKGQIDKPVFFTVDASEAGVGNLEVAVNEGRVPSMAQALGQHKYDISFVPKDDVDHTISVRFNNEPVPGSPFICCLEPAIHATAAASGPGIERIPVDEQTVIEIETFGSSGLPEVQVRDPQGELSVDVRRHNENLVVANYTPKCVGNHTIDISLNGDPIPGSPFTAKAFDARQARLTPCDVTVVGTPATFTIDAARAGAGNMEIIVSVDNRNVPNKVQAEGQAKFKVSFTPIEAKEHTISVKFNGISVPGSPMRCQVSPASATESLAPAISTGLVGSTSSPDRNGIPKTGLARELHGAQVGQKKGFTIENRERAADCNVIIVAPDGSRLPVDVENRGEEFYATFTPTVKGSHEISLEMGGEHPNEMPILFSVREARSMLPAVCIVGKKYGFDVDSDDKDAVRIDIRDSSGRPLPVQLEALPEGVIRASCRFKEVGSHTIETFVNEKQLGDIHYQKVVDPLNGVQLVSEMRREVVGQATEQKILIDKGLEGEVEVDIEGPDRQAYEALLKKVSDTLWAVAWTPKVEGDHEMSILVGGDHIPGSPFAISVLDPSAVRVIGLHNERVGTEIQFNVDYAASGASTASVDVLSGNRMVPCTVKRVKHGLLICSFTPTAPGAHLVDVTIDGLLLPECPYECYVTDVGSARASGDAIRIAQRARTARFEVSLNDTSARGELDVMVSDPKGGPLPVRCYKQQDDSYWVEFTPEHTGTHTIEVTFGDVPIAGSPFKCEVVDPKKVAVHGLADSLLLRHAATINVDRRAAGSGDLHVEVTDPTGSPLRVEMLKSPGGEDRATFLPNQTGPHKVNVTVAGFSIPGYPHTVLVAEQEQPGVYGAAIDQSIQINEPASLIFDPKKSSGGLKISVVGPNENKIRHNVMRRPNGTSEVVFHPEQVGNHTVSIDFNSKPLKGSPFTVRVVDPTKVIVNDLDMDRDGSFLLRLATDNAFDVDATAAGPGKLRAEVRDADSMLLGDGDGPVVDDLGYGKYRVAFNPRKPGKYSIYLYWNELPVESAFPVRARSAAEDIPTTSRQTQQHVTAATHIRDRSTSSQEDELSRVMVRGDGLHRAALKEQTEFIVDGSDLAREGRITATLLGQKADVPVRIQQLGHNVFKAYYTPLTGGVYELHVLWNGHHVQSSPFKVTVDSSTSPADLITVDASSLKIGIIGEEIKTLIDTRRSGPGQLSAQCMGPVKLAYCELYDHRDGTYTLNIRPAEVGKHTLTIKYNDAHVRGSPFLVHVSLPPDPSKVRVYGPGIEHGILSMFKSNFVVETRGAGAGQLTVRVRGPKGAFNVEMQREKKNERTIHCKYEPKEPGDYQVEVKWHGEHVPGSPFLIMIVDTEQELSRFLRGEAPSPSPATPFVPPGWVGPPPPMFHAGMGGPRGLPFRGPMGHQASPMGPMPPGMLPYGAPPPPRHKQKFH